MAATRVNWSRLKEVVADAIDAPADERETILLAACENDAELVAEARKLLAAHDDSSEVVLHRNTDPWLGLGGPDVLSLGGQKIGRYNLVRVLGEGAMSAVYLARQSNPDRAVAVKLLRTALPMVDARQRFRREAQALARLKHPNIAVIYEAGLHDTNDGRAIPFIAMEYIEGLTLDKYAAANKLDAKAKIELMIEVALAVQAAHQQAIIHRDLKPANVLVDAAGRPKVLDFGIARIAAVDADRATWQTTAGLLLGTPGYMSPEQCASNSDDIDVRADVWSLGVMTYELLLGRLPIETRGASLTDVLRRLESSEPTPPRSIDPAMRGDLETILMTAVCRDKSRRYATAQAFADDLRRYLNQRPIEARPPTTLYLVATFAQRNKLPLVIAATFLVILASAAIVSTVGFYRASQSLDRAIVAEKATASERDRALAAEKQSAGVVAFLLEVLRSPDPAKDGRSVTVLERIRASLPTIENRFRDSPGAESQVRAAIGRTLFELGEYDEARSQIERAIALATPLVGVESRQLFRLRVQQLEIVRWQFQIPEAQKLVATLLSDASKVLPPEDPDFLSILANVAGIEEELEHFDAAISKYEQLVAIRRRVEGDDAENTLAAMSNLGNSYLMAERYAEADAILREAIWRSEAKYGAESPNLIVPRFNLAQGMYWSGKIAEALPMFQKNLADSLRAYGPANDHTLIVRRALGEAYSALGQLEDALIELTATVDASRVALGVEHELTLRARNARAILLVKLKRFDEAIAEYREVIAAAVRIGSPASTRRSTMHNLGIALSAAGRPAEAMVEFDRIVAEDVGQESATSYDRAATQVLRGNALMELGHFDDARAAFAEAMTGFAAIGSDIESAAARRGIGQTYTRQGRFVDAERELLASAAVIEAKGELRLATRTAQAMVELYEASGQPEKAVRWKQILTPNPTTTPATSPASSAPSVP